MRRVPQAEIASALKPLYAAAHQGDHDAVGRRVSVRASPLTRPSSPYHSPKERPKHSVRLAMPSVSAMASKKTRQKRASGTGAARPRLVRGLGGHHTLAPSLPSRKITAGSCCRDVQPRKHVLRRCVREASRCLANVVSVALIFDPLTSGRGVERDDAEAVAWYFEAANLGHSKAAFNLGLHYEHGRGVQQDLFKSRQVCIYLGGIL